MLSLEEGSSLVTGWLKMFGERGYEVHSSPVPGGLSTLAQRSDRTTVDQRSAFKLLSIQNRTREGAGGKIRLQDPYESEPILVGPSERPDVLLDVQQLSFHPSAELLKDEYSAATLRFDVGQDDSTGSVDEPLFWCVAAGMDLVAGNNGAMNRPSDFRAEFSRSHKQSKARLPGGIGSIRFELEAHKPDPKWRSLLSFGNTRTGKALAAAVGFPMVALGAVSIIDEAFNRFAVGKQILSSPPVRYVFSKSGRDAFSGGLSVDIPSISTGLYALVATGDEERLLSADKFAGGHGLLLDPSVQASQASDPGADCFSDLTYAILRISAREVAAIDG